MEGTAFQIENPDELRSIPWLEIERVMTGIRKRELLTGALRTLPRKDSLPRTVRTRKPLSADEIAEMADRGESDSRFLTNDGKMMPAIQRVNVDFAVPMLKELDEEARG